MKMAKIINFPTLCNLTERQKNEFVMQVLELREKMNNIVDLISDQEQTNDLRQRLYNELMAVQSMLTDADEMVLNAMGRKLEQPLVRKKPA
jgi:hypothetical protein